MQSAKLDPSSYISFLVNEAVKSIEEQGDTSTTTSDIQDSYQDSFRYNQCLDGIEKAVDIDVSRLNNAIQVQFQFNENDRFAIQTREPPDQQSDNDALKRTTGRDCTAQYSEIHFDFANAFENYLLNKTDIYGTLPKPGTNITTESIVDNVGNEINCQNNIHESANAYFRDFMKEQSRKPKRYTISNVNGNRHAQNTEDNLVKNCDNVDDIIDLTDDLSESDTHSGAKKHRKSLKELNYLKETQSSSRRKNVNKKSAEDIPLMDIYQCGVCGKKFSRIDALSEHIDEHRDNIVRDARECTRVNDLECRSRKSDDKNDPVQQVDTHMDNAVTDAFVGSATGHEKDNNDENACMLCVTCGKTFNSQAELDKHIDDNHPVEGEHRAAVNPKEREYCQLFKNLSEKQNEHVQDVSENDRPISNQFTDGNRQVVNTVHQSIATQIQSVGVSRTSRSRLAFKRKSGTEGNTKETVSESSLLGNDHTFCQISRLGHQAKNSLIKPSKRKQKRVASHISKEDEIFMTRYGVSPSKVQLKKVHDKSSRLEPSSDKCQSKKVFKSSKPEPCPDISLAKKMNESSKQGHSPNKSKSKFGQDELTTGTPEISGVKTDISKNLVSAKETVPNIESSFTNDPIDNDLDVVIIEKPIELIVLDDSPEDIATSPKKSEKCQPEGNKTLDAMLLKQFGIKDVTVTLSKNISNVSQKQAEKKKYIAWTRAKRKVEFETLTPKIDYLNSEKTDNLLKQCGMNISIPVIQVDELGLNVPIKKDVIRSCSPQPSTSKGNGHLKIKRSARKSTKDTVLMEKHSLKESSVILKNLSRIELSMLRNPHSRFGKCDWLKHKFNSDSENDMEWDITNPPLTEEFEEAPSSGKNENDQTKKFEAHMSSSKKCGEGKSKNGMSLHMDGIPGSVFETTKKLNAVGFKSKPETLFIEGRIEKHHARLNENDKELIEKFGLPSAIVVIDSPLKESTNTHSSQPGNGGLKRFQKSDDDKICSKKTHIINDYSKRPQKNSKYNMKTSTNKKHYKNSESVISKRFGTNRLSENEKKLELQARELLHNDSVGTNSHEGMGKTKQTKHGSILGRLRAKSVLRAIESGQRRSWMVVQTDEEVQPDKVKSKSLKRSAKDTNRCTIPLKKPRQNIEQMAKKHAESKRRGPAQLKHRPPASYVARKQNIKRASCSNKIKTSKYLADIDILNRYKHLLKDFPQVKVLIPCLTQQDMRKFLFDPNKAAKVDKNVEAYNSPHADSNTMVQSIIEELLAQVCNSPNNVSNFQSYKHCDVPDVEIHKIDNHTETAQICNDTEKRINSKTLGKESITEISLSVAVENSKH